MPIYTSEETPQKNAFLREQPPSNMHEIVKGKALLPVNPPRVERKGPHSRIIYYSESDIEIVKCFGPGCIVDLHEEMQSGHPFLFKKENRIPVLRDFAQNKAASIGHVILEALEQPDKRDMAHALLNMPTFVGFRMLDVMGLPKEGDVVFSSTATANSAHDDAVTSALRILGYTDPGKKITYHRSSTVADDGFTAFGSMRPKNGAVRFNQHAQLDDFADGVARPLAKQFFLMTLSHNKQVGDENGKSLRVLPTYDEMYHYGCISQSKGTDTFGMPVTNWGIHEQWNILMGSAMMHHVALTLKAGGKALVKVRVMKRAETLGLVALLSSLFERLEIVDVPDHSCTYVGAIFFGMTDDVKKRQRVADTIWEAMDQSPANIFCNDVVQGDPRVRENLKLCEKHRRSMMDFRATVDTLFMDCVQHLVEQLKHGRRSTQFPMKEHLLEHYGSVMGEYFCNRWLGVHEKLVPGQQMSQEAEDFLWVMQRRWSVPWHGK
jgi:hypothetical protein